MNPGAYIALFGAGVASFANPCVLPLVPAYLGMIAGDEPHVSPHRRLVGTVVFVAGITAVFAGLGVVAEIAGRNVDELLSSIQRVGGVVIIVLGFIQLGAISEPPYKELASEHSAPHRSSIHRRLARTRIRALTQHTPAITR